MPDPQNTPNYVVSDACMSFTEVLMTCRSSVMTVDDANTAGRDLYAWFQGQDAVTDARAAFAKRSIDLGIRAIESCGSETVEDVVTLIKETYLRYFG